MTRRRVVGPAAICAVALLLGACGSGSDDEPVAGYTSASDETTSIASSSSESTVGPGSSSQAPNLPPPYIEGADWVETEVGPSLQIRPTRAGRDVSGDSAGDEAWQEVIAVQPDAETPGMRAQFDCHWTFARLVDPEKASWNLEPDRPVVSESEMISTRCNPGFAEEK